MRSKTLAVLLASLVLFGAGAPASQAGGGSMSVTSSSHVAGARPVRLAFTLRYAMQCGYPGEGPLVVTFPAAVKLPPRLASGSIKLAGKATAATIKRRKVSVTVPPHQGLLCGTIVRGSVTLTFTRAAKLANPAQPGSYIFTATHAKHSFKAMLAIKPAA